MPPAICDSEDEEEVLVEDDEPSQEQCKSSNFSYSQTLDLANQILQSTQPLEEANNNSSLSTGEIKRRIADTTGFFSSTTENSKMAAPASAAEQKLSRRHTNANASAASPMPPRGLKRTQTTYGKAKSKIQCLPNPAAEAAAFQALKNDERASQESLAYLQDSDTPRTISGLPAGSILQDFQEHNPNALFPTNSESTIENNASSQQRMLEMVRQPRMNAGPGAHKSSNESQEQHSSFPWSASGRQTQTPKVDQRIPPLSHDPTDNELNEGAAETTDVLLHGQIDTVPVPAIAAIHAAGEMHREMRDDVEIESLDFNIPSISTTEQASDSRQDQVAVVVTQHKASNSKPPPKSSPMVIIPHPETPREEQMASMQKPSRSRKRKVVGSEPEHDRHQRSESLNSDDCDVGLPKERYVPRLSRRRATAVADPVDSVLPKKAAKQRRVTEGASGDGAVHAPPSSEKDAKLKSKVTTSTESYSPRHTPSTSRRARKDEDADLKAAIAASLRDMEQSSVSKPIVIEADDPPAATSKSSKPADWKEPDRPSGEDVSPLSSPNWLRSKITATSSAAPRDEVQDMARPSQSAPKAIQLSPVKMLPPSLPASSTRRSPRRSHTTIFEDHASGRSPTLSQLQAGRIAAAEALPQPTLSNKRKRRTIMQNGLDDEDELGQESAAHKPDPKKRRYPSKVENVGSLKAAREVLDESEDDMPTTNGRKSRSNAAKLADSEPERREDAQEPFTKRGKRPRRVEKVLDDDSEDELEPLDLDEVVVKPVRKRGRPPKAKAKVHSESETEPELDNDNDEDFEGQTKTRKAPGRPAKENTQGSATQEPVSKNTKTALEPKDANANTAPNKATTPVKVLTPALLVDAPATKPEAKYTTPAPDVKPSPNSHSPIKKSAKGIHRVGLGRRQRVQPLLKIIRPDARTRKEDASRVTTITSVAELEAKWNEVPE